MTTNHRETIIFGLICLAIGLCVGFILFHTQPNQVPLGSVPNWDVLGNRTWDSF